MSDTEGQAAGGTPEKVGSEAQDSNTIEISDALEDSQKQIKQLKIELAGLDKKNASLLKEKDTKVKDEQKRQKQKEMSPKELEAFLAKESAEQIAEARREADDARTQLDKLTKEVTARRILNKSINEKSGMPNIIRRLLVEDRPEDPEALSEYIDDLIRAYETELVMSSNTSRVGARPKTGRSTVQTNSIPSDRDWGSLDEEERDKIARSLPKEKLAEILKKDAEKG